MTKTASTETASVGDFVAYTLTLNNNVAAAIPNIDVVDMLPPGFKYVLGSATIGGVAVEPTRDGRTLTWEAQSITASGSLTVQFLTVIGSGVGEGEYVNQTYTLEGSSGTLISNIATATVVVTPDPVFDCSELIGKVYNDINANGYQDKDEGEQGLKGIRLANTYGLLVTTDQHGRYHIPCAAVPNALRGSNYVLKLDERTLPSGYRMTTRNPGVVRLTRGKLVQLNFGSAKARMIKVTIDDHTLTSKKAKRQLAQELLPTLEEQPSFIVLHYHGTTTTNQKRVTKQLHEIADAITHAWQEEDEPYALQIETEIIGKCSSASCMGDVQ